MERTALVVGVTGIAGYNTAQALLAEDWRVVGLSRTAKYEIPGVEHVYADVLDTESVVAALEGRGITHLFFTTWSRHDTEAENCRVNRAMLANTLEGLRRTSSLRGRSQIAREQPCCPRRFKHRVRSIVARQKSRIVAPVCKTVSAAHRHERIEYRLARHRSQERLRR